MTSLSIRARLTIAILVLTGVLAALAVWGGTALLRDSVVDSAATLQLAALTEFEEDRELFDEEDLEPFIVGGDFVVEELMTEEQLDAIDDAFALEEALFAREIIKRIGLFGPLRDNFGTNDDRAPVQLSGGQVVLLAEDDSIDFAGEVETGQPVISIFTLYDLEGLVFERFEDDDSSVDYEYVTSVVGDTTYGLVLDVTDELRALDEVRSVLWFAAALLTVLAAASTWFLVGRALRPVGAITDRVQEISASDLAERVPESGRTDEIGVLATTMNNMLGRLERSDLRRRQFVSDASHELRTPVAVLKSEAEVARRAPDSTSVGELAEVVHAESQRLAGLVEDLLAIARHDESGHGDPGGSDPTRSVVDVDDIALLETERERGVQIDRSGISAGRINARSEDVARILSHLLDNAARHAKTRAAVTVRTAGETVEVMVDDDGAGIPAEDHERVFRRFIRLDEARNRDSGGAGLGLAVARSLVESSSGSITAGASPLGGARIRIVWPAAG